MPTASRSKATPIWFSEDVLKRSRPTAGTPTSSASSSLTAPTRRTSRVWPTPSPKAREAAPNQPKLIKVDTLIAWPTPGKTNDPSSHGSKLGAEAVAGLKELLGYDPEESFHVDEEALAHARKVAERGLEAHKEWDEKYNAWRKANPDNAALYDRLKAGELPEGFDKAIDDLEATFEVGKGVATRGASGSVLNAIAAVMPELWGGSADLGGSNKTDLKGRCHLRSCRVRHQAVAGLQPVRPSAALRRARVHHGYHHQRHPAGLPPPRSVAPSSCFSDYERSAVRLAAPHADSEPVCVVPRLRRRRRRWSDSPAGGAAFLPCHPAA